MTVETITGGGEPVTKSGPYDGNGVTSVFDYDFQIQDETELLVVRQNADLSEDTLTLTTDYTVAGVGADAGGQVTLVAPATALPTGTKLVLQYGGDYNQSADYSSQGGINLAELEAALDKLTMHLRSLKEMVDRSVKIDAFGDVDLVTLQANIKALALIETEITTVAGISAAVSAVAAVDTDVTAVAAIAANVTAVAGIVADVTAVAGVAADVSAVAAVDAAVAAVATITAEVATVAGVSADVSTVAGISAAVSNLSGISADVTRVADMYQGALAADPTTRLDGSALQVGDFYLNTGTGDLTFLQSTGPAVWTAAGLLTKASQAEAEAGTDDAKYMTPLRTADAIAALAEAPVKAWVNFNGTGTVAIRDSFNVSSITDNGVGDYTVNFTTAMADTNYLMLTGGTTASDGTAGVITLVGGYDIAVTGKATGSCQVNSRNAGGTVRADFTEVQVAFLG